MGGSNQGMIFNQTKENIYYTIHSQDFVPFEESKNTKLGGEIEGGWMCWMYAQAKVNASYEKNTKAKLFDKEGVYVANSLRMAVCGLKNLKFDGSQRISIITESGKILIKSGKINQIQDIRILISDDYSPHKIPEKEFKKLASIALQTSRPTMSIFTCLCCKGITSYKPNQLKLECINCNQKFQMLVFCRKYPLYHHACYKCASDIQNDNLVNSIIKDNFHP